MHALCEDDAVIGSSFYIMDHIDGCHFIDPKMIGATNAERAASSMK